ncbi:MAG: CocE/NonD family hydrolase [Candidatus Dormibacteria bacterium]
MRSLFSSGRVRFALLAMAATTMALPGATGPASAGSGVTLAKTYVTVSDGTSIAISISYPPNFVSDGSQKYPALFEMDGYQGYPSPNDNQFFGSSGNYVVVYAQIRGTGCSGGQFDLFSQRSAQDGYDIIESWMVQQKWSNGNVGITGHSYSGLTGFQVAETAPPHVKAIALSGLIDDFYRSILYPGGVFNEGFPILWGALLRPFDQFSGNYQNYSSDTQCAQNEAQHQGSDTVPVQLIEPVYTQTTATPDSWAITHSLFQHESSLSAPIQINQQYQDEQTGPRGGYILWQHVPSSLPKRLVLSNGQHNPNDPANDKGAWLDCWLINAGTNCGAVNDPAQRVLMYFESRTGGTAGQQRYNAYTTSDWPAPETAWTSYYLRADGALSTSVTGGEGQVSYVSDTTNQRTTGTLGNPVGNPSTDNVGGVTFTNGPDQARWTLPFAQTTALSGPILLNLWLTSTAPDTDVFADVIDYDPSSGEMAYLQRGLQRASYRAVDTALSDTIASGAFAGTIYRPYHDFLTQQLLTPLAAYQLPVEIFPLGHVFQAGHELILDLHAPPANDPISTYAYEPTQAPGVNTILQDASHPSTLLLPMMSTLPPLWPGTPAPCTETAGYVCFSPQNLP